MSDEEQASKKQHTNLIADLEKVVGKISQKSTKKVKTVVGAERSSLDRQNKKNIDLDDLIKQNKLDKGRLKIKEKLVPQPVMDPDHTIEKKQKSANYKKLRKQMNQWQDYVDENRNAKILKFPLNELPISEPSIIDWTIDGLRGEPIPEVQDGLLVDALGELSSKDKLILSKLNLQREVAKRRYLSKFYYTIHKYGAERNRVKKIKSKSYHRNLKKREKKELKNINIEEMKVSNPELYQQELDKLEKLRVEERARLKHKGGSKWQKSLLLKGSKNPEDRKALLEQASIAEKLTQKHDVEESSGDEVIYVPEVEEDDNIKPKNSNPYEDWDDGYDEPRGGKKRFYDLIKPLLIKYNSDKKKDVTDDKSCIKSKTDAKISFDFSKANDELLEIVKIDDNNDDKNICNQNDIAEAFQDDDAVVEFIEDNQTTAVEEEEIHGWGHWITPKKLEQNKTKPKSAPNHIRNNVIFNIQENTELKKIQPSYIPKKFLADYEKGLKKPIGQEWNNSYDFNRNIQPRIQILPGVAIPPLDPSTKCDPKVRKIRKMASKLPLKIRESLLSKL